MTDQLSSFLVAIVLGISSAGLIVWHVRVWKRLRQDELGDREYDFRRVQFRRRIQTSAMIGVLGVAICVGQLLIFLVPSERLLVIYWICVLLLVLWIVLLAVADMVATSHYFSREKSDFVIQHAKLQAELRKAREKEAPARNGKPGH